MAENNDVDYEYKTIKALRGLEGRTQTKLENEGWELVTTDRSQKLRTKMTFSRPKKKLSTKAVVSIAAGVVVLAGIITTGIIFGDGDGTQATQTAPSEAHTEAHDVVEPDPVDTSSSSDVILEVDQTPETRQDSQPEISSRSVAEAEARWLEIMQIDQPTDLINQEGFDYETPLHLIHPEWQGSTTGYLRIDVQEELNEESVQRLGINIMNLLGPEYPELQGVIFTDTTGIDHNFYRREAPLANLD